MSNLGLPGRVGTGRVGPGLAGTGMLVLGPRLVLSL